MPAYRKQVISSADTVQTVPTWQSETAQSHKRGKLVMIEGMLIVGGIFLSYWINYGEHHLQDREVYE